MLKGQANENRLTYVTDITREDPQNPLCMVETLKSMKLCTKEEIMSLKVENKQNLTQITLVYPKQKSPKVNKRPLYFTQENNIYHRYLFDFR